MLITIEDLRRRARRRLPRAVFDFIDGGAEDESTLRRNHAAFNRLTFRPRVLAPTGLCGMAAPRGEVLAARAATRTGTIFTLSSMSAVTIEDVMREAPGPHW